MKEMRTLVVEYLKERYRDRWKELMATTSRRKTAGERPKAQSSTSRRASLDSVHISVHL